MSRMVLHRTPVAVRHPVTSQWVGFFRGKEVADDDPIATDRRFAWLFKDSPEPVPMMTVRVEQATSAPGEVRGNRSR